MKYKFWLEEWLSLYVKPVVKIRTYSKYETIVRIHLVPLFGDYEMEEISAQLLQRQVVKLSKTHSGNYVNNIISLIQQSLRMAVSLGISRVQFVDKIVRPKIQSKKIECFTSEEQKKIEHGVSADGRNKMFGIVICLYTGLRIGELLALKWSDIELRKGLLTVNRSCHYGKNDDGIYGRIEETPKTTLSARVIPVPKQLIPKLKEIKKTSGCKYVVSEEGKPIAVRSYQRTFEILLRNLKIPRKNFHVLRHTFATRALECGMDVKTLSEILGHKNAEITLNRYAHSMIKHKTEMMNKLGKLFD